MCFVKWELPLENRRMRIETSTGTKKTQGAIDCAIWPDTMTATYCGRAELALAIGSYPGKGKR